MWRRGGGLSRSAVVGLIQESEGGGLTNVRALWFEEVASGTSGNLSPPTDGTLVLDAWADGVDALASEMDGAAGLPTFETPLDGSGSPVTATLDAAGNWALSAAPSAYPVGILFVYRLPLSSLDDSKSLTTVEVDAPGVDYGSVLPTPALGYSGQLFILLGGEGVADDVYVCLKKADGSYEWKELAFF